jgi:hypothetical protein
MGCYDVNAYVKEQKIGHIFVNRILTTERIIINVIVIIDMISDMILFVFPRTTYITMRLFLCGVCFFYNHSQSDWFVIGKAYRLIDETLGTLS